MTQEDIYSSSLGQTRTTCFVGDPQVYTYSSKVIGKRQDLAIRPINQGAPWDSSVKFWSLCKKGATHSSLVLSPTLTSGNGKMVERAPHEMSKDSCRFFMRYRVWFSNMHVGSVGCRSGKRSWDGALSKTSYRAWAPRFLIILVLKVIFHIKEKDYWSLLDP